MARLLAGFEPGVIDGKPIFWCFDKATGRVWPADGLLDFSEYWVHGGRYRNWHVADERPIPGVRVSTIFLRFGVPSFFDGPDVPPVLFETMVFGGPLDEERIRYRTLDEAEAGHAEMVARVLAVSHAGAS